MQNPPLNYSVRETDLRVKAPLWDRFNNALNVIFQQRLPLQDITGGGQHYTRQLNPFSPLAVQGQKVNPYGITGNGAALTGQLISLPLIDTSSNN